MERGRITVFAVTTAVLITAAVLAAFIYMGLGKETKSVTFPETPNASATSGTDYGNGNGSKLTFADVSPTTVQAVIKTLKRPDSYSRSMDIESLWENGQITYKINTWVKNGNMRLKINADGWDKPKNILLTDTQLFIWYGDNIKDVYKTDRGGVIADKALSDALQMIPTYEDVLNLDATDILEACYVQQADGWRITVTATDAELGYKETYNVSIDTGLLESAETYDGSTLVFKMTAGQAELSAPDDSLFSLN